MEILVLTEEELRSCITLDHTAMEAVAESFARLYRGQAVVPPIMMLPVPERRGEVDVKSALITGLDSLAVKIASGFFENSRLNLPTSSGLMVLVSTETGFPRALLLDNGYLTQVRTGAAGAVAAHHLAPEKVETAGVIGAGTQARYQMQGVKLVRDYRRLLVYSRREEAVDAYIGEMGPELGVEIHKAASVEEVVRNSSLVVTTTPAREPFLKAEWLHPGLHITAMGADTEEKQELHPEVLAKADLLVCDLASQCRRLGELHHALARGLITEKESVRELGELIVGDRPGRTGEAQISVCDLTGVGVQDTAIARLAFREAERLKLGLTVST
jgi:ectoine utilization protein EutC